MRSRETAGAVFFAAVFLLILPSGAIHAQTGAEIEALLTAEEVRYADAARFVLEAADVTAISDPEEAFLYAQEKGWLPPRVKADESARMNSMALLLMRAFGMKGGLFFTLFPNAHYAYREMVYHRVIQDRTDPDMRVSGDWLLFITGRVLVFREQGVIR